MNLRLQPLGKERVVFFNYQNGESPLALPPEIVLVRPNETPLSHFFSGKFWENLGIMTLASCFEKAGVRFGVLEASLFQCTRKRTAELAVETSPRIVGISVFSTDLLDECLSIADAIKELTKNVYVVLGGHGASFVHEDILRRNPAVDAVIRGEAEKSLLLLVQSKESADLLQVPSLSYRIADSIVVNPAGVIENNLDIIPLPHRFVRDLIADDPILSLAPLMMVTSRGCFDRCAFCSVTKFYANSWRGRSPKHVVDELEFLVNRYGRRSVHFWDDTFIGPGENGRRRAREIAAEIQKRALNVTFHVTTRPTDLDEHTVQALAAAGLRSVFLGIESSDQSTIAYFGKHAKVEQATAAIDLLWRHGVHRILTGFILFHPKMTWQSLKRDLDYLDAFPCAEACRIVSRLTYYPGAQFWLEHKGQLGPDCYKTYVAPPLPSDALEQLYAACIEVHDHTLSIESLLVCLEEQYLHRAEIIDFFASCRTRLFRFISQRIRSLAETLESGGTVHGDVVRFSDEVYRESLTILRELEIRVGDEYFSLLLKAYQLQNYPRSLDTEGVLVQ